MSTDVETSVDDLTLEQRLAELENRTAIIDVLCRYAVGIDRHRWDDFESCLADEIEVNLIRTGRWVTFARPELVALVRGVFETYTATQHISANHRVTIEGDRAVAWSTLNATHYLQGAVDGEFHQQVGYYEYHLVHGEDWRIDKMRQVLHWQRGNQKIFDSTVR